MPFVEKQPERRTIVKEMQTTKEKRFKRVKDL